jgi:hypothetical protein
MPDTHPGAQVYAVPSDDELITKAVANFLSIFSPRLLYKLSQIFVNTQAMGFGEIHLGWARGRLKDIYFGEKRDAHLLEEEALITSIFTSA